MSNKWKGSLEELFMQPIDKAEDYPMTGTATGSSEPFPVATTSTKRSRVINRDYVKRWALDYASTNRLHKFSRVSESFLNMIEADTKSAIRNRIMRHPSKGKTLQ